MSRTRDPFPVQGRILQRFTASPVHRDPLDAYIAGLERKEQAAREAVARGHVPDALPAELRGIPVQGRGVGGAIAGSRPDQIMWGIGLR